MLRITLGAGTKFGRVAAPPASSSRRRRAPSPCSAVRMRVYLCPWRSHGCRPGYSCHGSECCAQADAPLPLSRCASPLPNGIANLHHENRRSTSALSMSWTVVFILQGMSLATSRLSRTKPRAFQFHVKADTACCAPAVMPHTRRSGAGELCPQFNGLEAEATSREPTVGRHWPNGEHRRRQEETRNGGIRNRCGMPRMSTHTDLAPLPGKFDFLTLRTQRPPGRARGGELEWWNNPHRRAATPCCRARLSSETPTNKQPEQNYCRKHTATGGGPRPAGASSPPVASCHILPTKVKGRQEPT